MTEPLVIQFFIDHTRDGNYFTIPFTMPPGVRSFRLAYHYETHIEDRKVVDDGFFTSHKRVNIIDLGILAPDGSQVGASGSDKSEIEISETHATAGYHPARMVPGEWQILVGAYHVAPEGVNVSYEINFTFKSMQLYKGDLHTHTFASDGVLSAEELARHALRHGLDFLAVTDHNQMVSTDALPQITGLSIIPGIEWTHYQGHANFLGSEKPYDGSFMANSLEEVQAHFASARKRGALIVINHPFDENCEFKFPLDQLPFDLIEVWNGPMRESNLRSIRLWHSLLAQGRKIPICGGSDYHRDSLFLFTGGPTTCVQSMSDSPADLLEALKQGHSYIVFAPNGPELEMRAGDANPGDGIPFTQGKELDIRIGGLQKGDVVQVISAEGAKSLITMETSGNFEGNHRIEKPGFVYVLVLRYFVPGLPLLPALISNPIYFE